MTNPDNAVGTNGAFGGRTSVNAFNDITAAMTKGVVSGWACSSSSGLTVTVGGTTGVRDVALAEDNAGNKTTINNISEQPISVTLETASTTSDYIDYIVAYVNNPPEGSSDAADNPAACGIIPVRGAAAATFPTESVIRAAITSDGGTGSTAYYVVLACIDVPAGTTTITSSEIRSSVWNDMSKLAPSGVVTTDAIATGAVTADKIDFTTFKGSTDMPYTTTTISAGYGAKLTLVRQGNIVMANMSGGDSFPSDGVWTTLSGTVPSGYRPIKTVNMSGVIEAGRVFTQAISPDGSMSLIVSAQWTAPSYDRRASTAWITGDAWAS